MSVCHQEALAPSIRESLSLQLNLILSSKLFFLFTPNAHVHTHREEQALNVPEMTIGQRGRPLLISTGTKSVCINACMMGVCFPNTHLRHSGTLCVCFLPAQLKHTNYCFIVRPTHFTYSSQRCRRHSITPGGEINLCLPLSLDCVWGCGLSCVVWLSNSATLSVKRKANFHM